MKKTVRMIALVAAALVFLSVAKNALTQTVLTSALSGVTHVPVKIGGVNLSLLSASLRVENLRVHNPSGYPEKLMAEIPEIAFDLEPADAFKGRIHFKEAVLNLKQLTVVRDARGRLNVDALKPTSAERKDAKSRQEKPSGQAPKLQIDKLSLSIGRVVYKDYSAGAEPAIQTFDVNIQNREYRDIQDPAALVSLITFEALTNTALSKLADLDLHAFKEGGLEALEKSLGLAGNTKEAVQSTAKKLVGLFE